MVIRVKDQRIFGSRIENRPGILENDKHASSHSAKVLRSCTRNLEIGKGPGKSIGVLHAEPRAESVRARQKPRLLGTAEGVMPSFYRTSQIRTVSP